MRTELNALRMAALSGRAQEAELQRQMETRLEEEREKRVSQLMQVGMKRIMNRDLSLGWTVWHLMWAEIRHQRNLLRQAGTRLAKPKLAAAYHLWQACNSLREFSRPLPCRLLPFLTRH